MRTVAIINQKGGCGKTTTSINLAACLARLGHKTLLVDVDPQGHCGVGLAVPEDQIERTIYDAMLEERDGKVAKLTEIVWQIASDFDLAPSNIKLAGFEQVFAGRPGREDRLTQALEQVQGSYEWCIIDCPPSVGLLTFNALRACDEVIVPVETGFFSLHGLAKMMETLEVLKERCGNAITIRVLPTLYDTRTKLAREVLSELRAKFRDYLMESTVNFNTKLKEAASFGQPITEYDPGSRGYKDFVNLARELMGHRPTDVEPMPTQSLSRPAELVQRAKQLAQLTNFQFGRNTTPVPGQVAPSIVPSRPEPEVPVFSRETAVLATAPAPAPVPHNNRITALATINPQPATIKSTEQKIDEFYGVKQVGEEVIFSVRFDKARRVQIAGDFNNWSPMSTPMMTNGQPGVFKMSLPLKPGRYRYRFVVDGNWVTDPNNQYVEANQFGELNNVVEVDERERVMADQQNNPDPKQQSLSDISHLFLSSVRDRQTGGAPRPQRTPPKTDSHADLPADLTPEEFAQVIGGNESEIPGATKSDHADQESPDRLPPISAIIAPHLNGSQRDRVREYAAHLCKSGERVGLIELDASEFRVSCFELGSSDTPTESAVCDALDGRRMSETLDEMSWDVDRWLLNVPNPRLTEARAILRSIDNWTVLATCDHDGVVACYRSLKGLADVHAAEVSAHAHSPTLSLALLDARDELAAIRVFRKLSGVCQQFLHWPLESEAPVLAAGSVAEHQVLVCRATRDKAQLASAPQWQVTGEFVMRCRQNTSSVLPAARPLAPTPVAERQPEPAQELRPEQPARPTPKISQSPAIQLSPMIPETMNEPRASDAIASDVIDLPDGADAAGAIVAATMRGTTDVIECPVKPPMLAESSLAVTRDRRLVLFAVAKQGLSDLRSIGEAWRWMNENRVLISMAMPQLQIDPHQMPHLRLLVDRADLSASTLQPLLQTGHVTVQTYRKLRWGPKTGLLLEAA